MGPAGGAGAAAPIISAAGALFQGVAGLRAGRYNRDALNTAAVNTERDAAAEAGVVRDNVRQQIGQQLVEQGGSGFEIGTGSALDALFESQVNGMLDVLNVQRKGAATAAGYRERARLAEAEGRSAFTSSLFGAAAAIAKPPVQWG